MQLYRNYFIAFYLLYNVGHILRMICYAEASDSYFCFANKKKLRKIFRVNMYQNIGVIYVMVVTFCGTKN